MHVLSTFQNLSYLISTTFLCISPILLSWNLSLREPKKPSSYSETPQMISGKREIPSQVMLAVYLQNL
jgi:hypothetical protein